MKLTAVLLFFSMMHASAIGYAQKISISAKNVPLENIFEQIIDKSDYDIFYTRAMLRFSVPVTVNVKNQNVLDVLEIIFKNQPLQYTIEEKTIIVTGKKSLIKDKIIGQQELIDVSGIILDEKGNPISGASVGVKGKRIQIASDENGKFLLKSIDANSILIISSIGYRPIEIPVKADLGNIKLEVQESDLEEVTISTGYQTVPKERVTGSFSTIPSKRLEEQRLSSLNSLLEGRIPGYNNGLIRGTTSMTGFTRPLFVVDGFPVENNTADGFGIVNGGIPGLNLEDIASITVLKDAAAVSIYGARAANGVVVIITKKGKVGKPQISASTTFTTSPYRYYRDNLINSSELIDLEKEWAANNPNLLGPGASGYAQNLLDEAVYPNQGIKAILQNYTGALSNDALAARLNDLSAAGFQYYKDVEKFSKRNPFYQQHNINVGSATEKNSFYGSATYWDNKLEDIYSNDKQLGINLKNSSQLTTWLNLEVSTYLNYTNGRNQSYQMLSPGYTYLPYDRLVNADGSYFVSPVESRTSKNIVELIKENNFYNMDITPLEEQSLNVSKTNRINSRSYIKLKVDITKWLSYTPSFQYENTTNRSNTFYDKRSYYVRNLVNSFATPGPPAEFNLPYGNIDQTESQFTNAYNFRQQFNIDKKFGEHHNLTALAGSEIRNTKLEFDSKYLYNYDPQVLTSSPINENLLTDFYSGILGYPYYNRGARSEIINRFVSLYANAGYSYDEKYLLTGSVRWDRSNLWGTSSKYQNKPIWSAGAGWNIDREAFLSQLQWINTLKVRFSYGTAGNIDPSSSPFIVAGYFPNYNLGGNYGIITKRPNPLLSWEMTTTVNAGVDFSLFNRLSGSVDFYNKRGKDLLANTSGVPTEGLVSATYQLNNGKMVNNGVELGLSGDVIRSSDLSWNVGVQYAINKNKVTYVNLEAPSAFTQMEFSSGYPQIGRPLQSLYSYKWAGLNEKGLPQVYDEKGRKVLVSPQPNAAAIYSGTTVPVYSGAFNSTLNYKNFNFSFLLTFEGGHKMRNTFLPTLPNSYASSIGSYLTDIIPVNREITDRWRKPGDENRTNVPRVLFGEDPDFNSDSFDLYRRADIHIINAANIRLRNISLAYKIPSPLLESVKIKSARLQFNVENAFMLTKDKNAKYLMGGYTRPNYVCGVYLNF